MTKQITTTKYIVQISKTQVARSIVLTANGKLQKLVKTTNKHRGIKLSYPGACARVEALKARGIKAAIVEYVGAETQLGTSAAWRTAI
jgi:hypothetical protein